MTESCLSLFLNKTDCRVLIDFPNSKSNNTHDIIIVDYFYFYLIRIVL
jgi:hypothetical protein